MEPRQTYGCEVCGVLVTLSEAANIAHFAVVAAITCGADATEAYATFEAADAAYEAAADAAWDTARALDKQPATVPTRRRKTYTLRDGSKVRGCRELGCWGATLGPFCTEHAKLIRKETR